MRILHEAPEHAPQQVYGLGRFVRDLAVAQARRGDEVTVVTNSLGGAEYDVVRDGVRVCRTAFPPPPKPPLTEAQVLQFNMGVISRTLEVADGSRETWDVVNVHDWYLLPAANVLRDCFGLPVCFTVHDTVVGKTGGKLTNPDKFIANMEIWGCRSSDNIICCSRFMRQEIAEHYGAPMDRTFVVPCGVSEATFAVQRLEWLDAFRSSVAGPKDRIVLYVGRLDPEKGVDLLIEAAPLILAGEPRAKILIVGKGRRSEELQDLCHRRGLKERVSFLGYAGRAPLAFLYRCAEVQVCPSLYEPFGIVALEGMVNGLPVVVPDNTGLTEIVGHERDGLQFGTGSAGDLAEAVCRLLSDHDLARRLATAGRRRALEDYDWDRIASATRPAYEHAMAGV